MKKNMVVRVGLILVLTTFLVLLLSFIPQAVQMEKVDQSVFQFMKNKTDEEQFIDWLSSQSAFHSFVTSFTIENETLQLELKFVNQADETTLYSLLGKFIDQSWKQVSFLSKMVLWIENSEAEGKSYIITKERWLEQAVIANSKEMFLQFEQTK